MMKQFSLKVLGKSRLNPAAGEMGGRSVRFGKWKSLQSMIAAILLASVIPAYSATIVDTGAPLEDFYYDFGGWSYFAGRFDLAGPVNVTSVEGYFSNQYEGTSGVVSVQILKDGGSLPGDVVFSQDVDVGAALGWYGAFGLNWNLNAGTYWVAFVPVSSIDGQVTYPAANPLDEYAVGSGGVWTDVGHYNTAVRINGDSVAETPVPAALPLFATGLAGLGLIAHRRRKAKAA